MKHGKFEINTVGLDYFVGDIHGEMTKLWEVLEDVGFNENTDRLFSVGDLVDRGPYNVDAVKLLKKPWFHAVKGNHDDMMLGGLDYHIWMWNGGEWSNEITSSELDELKELAEAKMYDKITVQTGHGSIGVIHAEWFDDWNSEIDIPDYSNAGMPHRLWGRSRIRNNDNNMVENIDVIVCGHTPVKFVTVKGNHLYIDTGACFASSRGYLTIVSARDVFTYINN